LRGRATEPEEVIQRRLEVARRELEQAGTYRHTVINDEGQLDRAVKELAKILTSE